MTRGKVPTVETVKHLIDMMAYYKLNSLQLYVEHTFEFDQFKQLNSLTDCLTAKEMQEIGEYCWQNFIDFIPSLSTFGHLYELLELEQYKHLRVLKDYDRRSNHWHCRMARHTIDPLNPQSIEVIKSLIDQYAPHFESEHFNICCDETFDLKVYDAMGYDCGKLYVDFVNQIIEHVRKKDKNVMMWADILLKHPEVIKQVPEDTCFLNWDYAAAPSEEKIARLSEMGRKQIVCPGTTTWNRLCEDFETEEKNICRMAEYGFRHGAVGVLNTNWGDWGNPCCIELAMYGMVLGAEKSWSVSTEVGEAFYSAVNSLLYENEKGTQYLKELSEMHKTVSWTDMCKMYCNIGLGDGQEEFKNADRDVATVQKAYRKLKEKLSAEKWAKDEYRQQMLLAAEGLCVIAELLALGENRPVNRLTDTNEWFSRYAEKWLESNKKSELYRLEEMFLTCDRLLCEK